MKTLIVYATKHGCAEKCAKSLAEKLNGKVELYNLREGRAPQLKQYDKVIVGGSIYIGKIQKEVAEFCKNNICDLKDKKIGLFLCGMRSGNAAEEEISASFPKELLNISIARECFGGEFIFSKMNVIERFIVKKIAKTDKDISNISENNIGRFAQAMNNA